MLDVRLLGDLGIELDGKAIPLPRSRRACTLLAWLALHPGPHGRSRLAALLWPDVLDASARASLRSAIWALRVALGPEASSYLVTGRDAVELCGGGLRVDVREFDRLLAAGEPADAVTLYRGELLSLLDADWVFDAREECRERLAAAFAGLAGHAEAAGDGAAALDWARRRAALRPLDEEAGRELIRLLAASGDVAGALAAYTRLSERLDAELGIGPGAETARLAATLRGPPPTAADRSSASAPAEPAPDLPRLVGRDRQARSLRAAWRAARSGTGTAVAISGDGGMGKTRLVHDLLGVANADDARTAIGTAGGLGATAPFAPWSELLGDLMAQTGPPPGKASWQADLTAIRASATEPGLDRVRFFEATVALLSSAARDHPLALALEDLHLADRSSLELIAYAGRRIARLPILLVLTRRRLPPRPELDAALGALRARGALGAELELAPLPAEVLRELLRSVPDLAESQRERIVALASGSPLIAVETASACVEGGEPATGLRGATRLMIGRLGGAGRLLVELAAVAGRDLDRSEVASLPLLLHPARAATEALGSGLIQSRDGMTGFRHELLREAVYLDMPDPGRARLHETLAHWLRERPARNPARRAAEIARHFRLAGRDDLAVDHLARAAAAARTMAAFPEAAAFLEEAVSLAEAGGLDAADPDLLVELAEVQAWRGMTAESDDAFNRALELIAPDDDDALVSAWLRRGHWLRGGICYPRESLRSYRAALDFLDRDPGADPPARAQALAGMAWAQAVAGDLSQVDELLREAAEATGTGRPGGGRPAPESGGDLLTHDIAVARGHALLRAGRFTDSYGPLIAASIAAGRAGRPDLAYSCLANAASAAACAGDLVRALEFADRCLPLVVPNGLLRLCVYVQSARAALLRRLGRLGEARVACDTAAAAADRIGLAELAGLVHHDRGLLAAAAGDPATAAAELGLALDLNAPVSRPLARLLCADALARAGRADDAEQELRAVVLEPVSAADLPDTLVARMTHVQGLIALQRGELPLARQRLREAAASWRRRAAAKNDAGEGYVAALIDLGRPPISTLVEPERELAVIDADLAAAGRS